MAYLLVVEEEWIVGETDASKHNSHGLSCLFVFTSPLQTPPLCISVEQIDLALDIIGRTLKEALVIHVSDIPMVNF